MAFCKKKLIELPMLQHDFRVGRGMQNTIADSSKLVQIFLINLKMC